MKNFLLLCLMMSGSFYCTAQQSLKDLDWLTGEWNRTNTKPGRSGFEYWGKTSDTEMVGKGITLNGEDTVVVEKLKIIVKDGDIYYVADVQENQKPVLFRFIQVSRNGFVCENEQHDFPKKITYSVEGKTLKATISGDGKQIDYLFEKKP